MKAKLIHLRAKVVDEGANGNFDPIPILSVENATVILAFASPSVVYTAPSDDLWLSAHEEGLQPFYDMYVSDNENLTVFYPDEQVSVLACLEQHQLCNPNSPSTDESCTPFRSMYHSFTDEELQAVFSTGHQIAIANNILSSILGLDYYVDETTLLAESFAAYGLSLPLAANQWILEVENWFTIGQAVLQRFMLETITGPASSQYSSQVNTTIAATDPTVAWMCENQIINRGDYTNFRTLTISLIFALGIIVYATNQSLEFITGSVRQKWRTGRWRQRAWWAEGTLQLQRRTFEETGIKWELDEWDRVPVTEKGVTFSALRNWDERFPLNSRQKGSSAKTSQDSSEPRPGARTEKKATVAEAGYSDAISQATEPRAIQRQDTSKASCIVQVDSISTFNSEGSSDSNGGDGETQHPA
jgi:hypothetical protein